MTEVRRSPDADALARDAARLIADRLRAAVTEHGRALLALSGGSTPRATYALLGDDATIPWDRVHLFWGDERWVPAAAPESNQRLVDETLLASGRIPPANVHPVPPAPDPTAAAAAYESELRRFIGPDGPSFDVALQGLGEDGHTASLFPGGTALLEQERWVVAVPRSPQPPRLPRITLTLPILNRSRVVLFLVAGEAKSAILVQALAAARPPDPPLPAARLVGRERTIWLVDAAAASGLPSPPPAGAATRDSA